MYVCMCVHADMCDQGDVALTSNGNNDTIIVTFVNTTSGQTSEVSTPLSYRYVPTSETCGQHFELCNTIALTSENQTVVILPLNGSVGFVLRNSELDSNDSLQWHTVSPEIQACVFITFVPVDINHVVGYCLKLGTLYVFDVTFSYTSLDLSRIQPRIVGNMYQLGISANRTNFIYFDNNPSGCFSTELPYVFLLVDNVLIEHSFGDGFTEPGTIPSSATCTKLQRVGDCALAAYCGREVFTFLIDDEHRENFAPTPVTLPDEGGLILLCSSSYLVYMRNSSLTLFQYDLSNTWSPLSDPTYTQLDEEDIVRGNCYSPEIESTTFVVTLHGTNSSLFLYRVTLLQQDSSTTTANITDITPMYVSDGGHMGSDRVITQTTSQYALVSNGISTTIFNWVLPCYESPLVIPSAFTFVSFFTTGSMYPCSCSSSTTTSTNPTNPTIPTTISSTISNPTTPSSTTGSPPSSDSFGYMSLIVGSYVFTLLVLIIVVIIIIIIIIYACKK